MSIKLMTDVWQLDIKPTHKLVLLALADNANDSGVCWPSVSNICEKSSLSERCVREAIQVLEAAKLLVIHDRAGRSNYYTVTPARGAPLQTAHPAPDAPHPGTARTSPLHVAQGTPARGAPITIIEPSIESSGKHVCEFAEIKAAYPKFSGRQDWISAEHHWNLRIEQGANHVDLLSAVRRYRAFAESGGVSGPQYVLTPAKFFSAVDKPWMQDWTPPPTKAETRLDSNVATLSHFISGGNS